MKSPALFGEDLAQIEVNETDSSNSFQKGVAIWETWPSMINKWWLMPLGLHHHGQVDHDGL